MKNAIKTQVIAAFNQDRAKLMKIIACFNSANGFYATEAVWTKLVMERLISEDGLAIVAKLNSVKDALYEIMDFVSENIAPLKCAMDAAESRREEEALSRKNKGGLSVTSSVCL